MTTFAIIVAAGRGERAGGAVPKQYASLAGKPVFLHSTDAFLAHPGVQGIVLVVANNQMEQAQALLGSRPIAALVSGGKERQDSVRPGLDAAARLNATRVLIHDAARPSIPPDVIDRLLRALETAAAAIPALPVVDTLARRMPQGELGEVVDRSSLLRVQTPQAFDLNVLIEAHSRWSGAAASDDAQMVRQAGIPVAVVEGDPVLEKITLIGDLSRAEGRFTRPLISRTGMGYDVHRFEAGRPLWLGGIAIPHDRGLAGHSDADVALHALVDALLGAIGDGDIGTHFPPSDPRWRGAESTRFLSFARERISAVGGIIDHVDLTIICEAPKIAPHREAIRNRIAGLLALAPERVSVKATTTERLGFTGREEGIAAQAIATVRA